MQRLVRLFAQWIRREPRTVHLHHTSVVWNHAAVFDHDDVPVELAA